jgi:hypothetical protein
MRAPYLAHLGVVDGVGCFRVDGHWLRDRWDVDFTNGAHHFTRRYVPLGEVWVDRDAPGAGETDFLVQHQLCERALMSAGASYHQALLRANRLERRLRRAAIDRRLRRAAIDRRLRRAAIDRPARRAVFNGPAPSRAELRARIHRQLLGAAARVRALLWRVDGRAVRDHLSVDFTLGGHGLRYRFIPRGEIWIDDAVVADEVPAIVLHEEEELRLMRAGLGYAAAHRRASQIERRFRERGPAARRGLDLAG